LLHVWGKGTRIFQNIPHCLRFCSCSSISCIFAIAEMKNCIWFVFNTF
jgi:hypothetical protein